MLSAKPQLAVASRTAVAVALPALGVFAVYAWSILGMPGAFVADPAGRIEFTLLCGALLVAVTAIAGAAVGQRFGRAQALLDAERGARVRAEQRFQRLFSSAPFAMLMVDGSGRITLANAQAERLFGYRADVLCCMTVEALIPEDMRRGHAHMRKHYDADPSVRAMGSNRDLRCLDASGHQVPVEVGLAPMDSEAGHLVLVSLIDLTERKAAEAALAARAEALARSNRELDSFAYVASHDLKAPLRGITQLANFIMEDAGEVLPPDSHKDLVLLQGRIARMEALLDGLLQYSRIGRIESRPEWVDTRAVLLAMADLCVPADRFVVTLPDECPAVFAPRAAVELVVRNLLSNAVKHHDRPGGVLTVSCASDETGVHLIFADDGPGVAPAYAERIFGLFQTLRPRDEVEGSGIGLALVRKTLEHHGAQVCLLHHEGRGARFRVTWPHSAARFRSEEPET